MVVAWHFYGVAILACRRSATAATTSVLSAAQIKDTVHYLV